jgi:hypothetical protein
LDEASNGKVENSKHDPKAEMQVQREENVAAMITIRDSVDLEDLLRLVRSCHVNDNLFDSNPKLNVDFALLVTG